MKRFIIILAVICIIIGCIIGKLSTVPQAELGAVALEAFGFAALIIKTLKKAEKKTWKEYTSVILFAIAGILCAVAGIAEATMTSIIAAAFALVAMIIGLFIVKKKNA
jgi:preprotein translocase subunit Sss1